MTSVAGEVGADAEHTLNLALAGALDLDALLEVERVAKDDTLGHRVDAELLVALDGEVDKGDRVARVVAHTVEEAGVLL